MTSSKSHVAYARGVGDAVAVAERGTGVPVEGSYTTQMNFVCHSFRNERAGILTGLSAAHLRKHGYQRRQVGM